MPTSGDLVSTSGRAPNASRSASTTASLTFSAAKPECVSAGVSPFAWTARGFAPRSPSREGVGTLPGFPCRMLAWTASVLLSVNQSRHATARAPAYSAGPSGASNSASCIRTRTATRARRQTLIAIVSGPSNQTPPRSPLAPAMRIAASSRRSAPSVPRAQVTKNRNLSAKARVIYSGSLRQLTRAGVRGSQDQGAADEHRHRQSRDLHHLRHDRAAAHDADERSGRAHLCVLSGEERSAGRAAQAGEEHDAGARDGIGARLLLVRGSVSEHLPARGPGRARH